MSQPSHINEVNSLTDKQIAELFLNLSSQYKELKQSYSHMGEQERFTKIFSRLNERVAMMIADRNFSNAEKQKIFEVLSTVISSMPDFETRGTTKVFIQLNITVDDKLRRRHHRNSYSYFSDDIIEWMFWSNLFSSHCHSHSLFHSHHHSGKKSKEQQAEAIASVALILIVIALVASAFIASYYIIKELYEASDRLWFGEWSLRALSSITTMLAMGAAGAGLGYFFVAPIAAALCAAVVTNPIGITILSTIAMGLIFSGAGALLFNKLRLQDKVAARLYPDAIDPVEAHRFSLTDSEQRRLEDRGFDILKVKCAMALIRQQMGGKIHSKSVRLFKEKYQHQEEWLGKLRSLKRGELRIIEAEGIKIDCIKPHYLYSQNGDDWSETPPSTNPEYMSIPSYNPDYVPENGYGNASEDTTASAPPL